VTASFLLAFLLSIPADDPPKAPVVKQEIVVTAAREEQPRDQAAAAVTTLDKQAIERLPAQSLSEVLAYVPGVTMMFDSGASGIPMMTSRGFFGGGEVEYVKLIVDGVPVGDAESGNVDWQRIRAVDIDRIEVLHGPGSALYGDTALGGVIAVFTRGNAQNGSSGDVHLSGGSFGSADFAASYGADLAAGTHLDARAVTWQTDGFRPQARVDNHSLQLVATRTAAVSRWRLDLGADRGTRHQPGPLTPSELATDREQSDALFRFDGQTTTRRRIAATFESFASISSRATVYALRRDDDNLRTLLLAPGFGTSALRNLTTHSGGGTFEAAHESAAGTYRAGADLERTSLSGNYAPVSAGQPLATVASETGRRDRIGLFVSGGWSVCERCRLTAGMRRDEIRDDVTASTTAGTARSRDASAWSPRAGFNVRVGPQASPFSVFVQASRAFKAPTLDQLFDPRPYPNGKGGTFTISNASLRPQRARNLEAGVSRSTPWSEWSVVAYRMRVTDEIDFDPQTFAYLNIGSSLHHGAETSLTFAKTARVFPQLTYSWTRVADAETPDRQLKNIPEHAAQLLLHARISARTSADAIYRWRGALTLDDAGKFTDPAVSRVDLRLSHDIRALRLQADLLNALNARYNELGYVLLDFRGQPTPMQFPAPGRALRLGATWTF
jgi:iron complex outermembrane receptor protein